MLEHNETMRLIALSKEGDEKAKTMLIKENMPLIF